MERVEIDARGFSMVELMVVLVIISLSLAFALPRFTGSYERLQLKSTASKLAASFRRAQGYAIARKENVRLGFDLDQQTVRITAPQSLPDGGADQDQAILHTIRIPQHMALTAEIETAWGADPDQIALWFFPDGSSNGGTVQLAAVERDQAWHIVVDGMVGTAKLTPAGQN